MKHTPDQLKLNAVAFYDLMFNQCRPREAIEQFVGDTYTQHSPEVADGKHYFEKMAAEYPGKQVQFKRSIVVCRPVSDFLNRWLLVVPCVVHEGHDRRTNLAGQGRPRRDDLL